MNRQTHYQMICDHFRLEGTLSETPKAKICSVVDGAGRRYAAKLTSINSMDDGSFRVEVEVFSALSNGQIALGQRSNSQTPEGFPDIYFVGRHGDYNVIIMDMLTSNLYDLCRYTNFSIDTYQLMACEMLDRIKELHLHGFVHCDVKPENFMMDSRRKIHLIDFGLSTRYRDPRTNAHIPEGRESCLIGTLIYCSINAQNMITQSRRDDLESLGYSLIEMIKKRLPWEGGYDLVGNVQHHVAHMKQNTTLMRLCKNLPRGIYEYMMNVTSLSYSETPDYRRLREMLRNR